MNVVVVNDYAQVNGGASQVALASAGALAHRGHEVTVFTAVGATAELPDHPGRARLICTGQHEIARDPNRMRAALQGLWNQHAARTMRELLNGLDPRDTVVHFHGWTKALSSSVIHECLSSGFPSVTTLHEYFSACPNGGFFDYQRQTICGRRPLGAACVATHCDARSYPQKLWRVGRQYVQRVAGEFPGGMRHFITLSGFSMQVLKPYLPADARFHAVPNPIDVPREAPVAVDAEEGFVYAGRLAPEKGGILLARAARPLRASLTFVGDGEQRGAISAEYPQARITGWLAPAAVRRQLRRSRALVLPSLWYETQGLVVLEAAALGVPAIVPAGSAARDFVLDGVTGLWFRSGDENDLRDKLRMLQEDAGLAATLGKAAYEHFWRDPPTLDKHAARLEDVYRQVLN